MSNNPSHTERFNRILVNWLALQEAMNRLRREGHSHGDVPLAPWNCDDPEVGRLWEQLTHPDNLAALWEWLYQIAPGEPETWALQALQESRRRAEERARGDTPA